MEPTGLTGVNVIETVVRTVKQQRLVWSSAIIVALVLILVAHAPILPVLAGCIIALAVSALRSLSRNPKSLPPREHR